jgi:predicted nucleotidyltransferase
MEGWPGRRSIVEQAEVEPLVSQAADVLADRIRVSAVYVFGSQVSGVTDEFSDIDIAVFSPDVAELGILGRARLGTLARVQVHRDLAPHFFPAWALEDPPKGSFAEHVINTGKRIV